MTNSVESASNNHESHEVNSYTYPRGYFDAQVVFAQKWCELTGEDIAWVLATKTTVARQITGDQDLLGNLVSGSRDHKSLTDQLYSAYTKRPESMYVDLGGSSFGYDYHPDTKIVKIHFSNPRRGERPLSEENMIKRREEFRVLLQEVRSKYPEAALLMSATWLRSTASYRSLSPPDIDPERDLMSPEMKLTGNSVWGQFVDASGNLNRRVYDQFVASVRNAQDLDELMSAFPYRTVMAVDPIEKYYKYYGLLDN